jgi:Flp pilus assembly protein TadG
MSRRISSQKGASMVEFALVLPLLLLILFGIIEFGLLMYNKEMITNSSREGARRGIVYRVDLTTNPVSYAPLTDPQVQTEVTNYLSNHLITLKGTSTPTITVTRTTETAGNMLRVQVDYPYNFLILPPIITIPLAGGGTLTDTVTLSSATKMRME